MSVAARMSAKNRGQRARQGSARSESSTPEGHSVIDRTERTIEGRLNIVLENLYEMGAKKHPLGNVFKRTGREMLRDLRKFPEDQIRAKLLEFQEVLTWVADAPEHTGLAAVDQGEDRKELSA